MQRTHSRFPFMFVSALAILGFAGSHVRSEEAKTKALRSGVAPGQSLVAFSPMHVTGADKNTLTCPICHYPTNPAVQVWVNTDDVKNLTPLISGLENATTAHTDKKLKVFVIFINPARWPQPLISTHLQYLARKASVKNVAMAYLPGPQDEAVGKYEINTDPRVKNTVFVYRYETVQSRFINFVADKKGLNTLNAAIKKIL